MGCDLVIDREAGCLRAFQSTHPVWDATSAGKAILSGLLFQSTHPVWDATTIQTEGMTNARISIHASRMGCDRMLIRKITQQGISIHASRMGCDVTGRLFLLTNYYFNPRIPYGMRRVLMVEYLAGSVDFNPRIPYGMRHSVICVPPADMSISIHASRMGCDRTHSNNSGRSIHFNPRIPYGMRRVGRVIQRRLTYFNPRIPYGMRHVAQPTYI